jgi:hypothetical protein
MLLLTFLVCLDGANSNSLLHIRLNPLAPIFLSNREASWDANNIFRASVTDTVNADQACLWVINSAAVTLYDNDSAGALLYAQKINSKFMIWE